MKAWQIILLVAGILTAVGMIVGFVAAAWIGFNFKSLSFQSEETVTNTYTADGTFENIRIHSIHSDITFLPSTEGAYVVCTHGSSTTHEIKVENNALIIEEKAANALSLGAPDSTIEVYLPQPEYQDLTIQGTTSDVDLTMYFTFHNVDIDVTTGSVGCRGQINGELKVTVTTGDIAISKCQPLSAQLKTRTGSISALGIVTEGDVSAKVTTGNVYLSYIKATNLSVKGVSGDVTLDNVIISQLLTSDQTTGDLTLNLCDAAQLQLKTTTGDISGSLLSDKVFTTHTTTGSVSVPQSAGDGTCDLSTTTGDISITIQQAE